MDPVDLLLDELVEGGTWPPKRHRDALRAIRTWRAYLESDRDELRVIAGWQDADRDYKVDPLPELIADTWADHIWGDDPVITPASPNDAAVMSELIAGQDDLTGELHGAERVVVGEGESWWRIYRDAEVADVPLLEWHSRDVVFPLWVGRRLLAVALVTELERKPRQNKGTVYRHFELHVDEAVEHVLFKGTKSRIGSTVPLSDHPDTLELELELAGGPDNRVIWAHGLPMLMGRVANRRGRIGRNIGVSEFDGIEDALLDLNEAATIGAENMRLTAKKRAIVPEEALTQRAGVDTGDLIDRGDGTFVSPRRPGFNAGEDLLVVSALDQELGKAAAAPFTVLEYSFDADALIAWKRDLVETALTRRGLTPQYVGVATANGDGLALSGTALRLRLIPTTKAGKGKARPWDGTTPRILSLMAQLDALPEADGGFGRAWTKPDELPAVERPDALPIDEVEDAQVEATLVGAGVRSVRESVRRQHPDWTDTQVDDEVAEIRKDRPPTSSLGLGGAGFA